MVLVLAERSGHFHTTYSGAMSHNLFASRVVSVYKQLRSQDMKYWTGSFDGELFVLPSNNFISCVSRNCPPMMPIEMLAARQEALAQWRRWASVAVFTSWCLSSEVLPSKDYDNCEAAIASAIQLMASCDDDAAPPSGCDLDQYSFNVAPKSTCSVTSPNNVSVAVPLSPGLALVDCSFSAPAPRQDQLPLSCSEEHCVAPTCGRTTAGMPMGIPAEGASASRRNSIDLSRSCVVAGCPLGRYPVTCDSFLASAARQCNKSHWLFDFDKGCWPCCSAPVMPSREYLTSSGLPLCSSTSPPHVFNYYNPDMVKAEQNMHLLACNKSSCWLNSQFCSSATSCQSDDEADAVSFCKTGSFASLMALFRERSLAAVIGDDHANAEARLASSVRSSFLKQIHQAAKSHLMSVSPDQNDQLSEDDVASSCSFATSIASSKRHIDSDQHHGRDDHKVRRKRPKFSICSYNGNSWKNLKALLRITTANFICSQEHRLYGDRLADARLWARSNGWQSFWAPAAPTRAGGVSGGVAVFVRAHVQAWLPQDVDPIFCAHRGLGVIVNCGSLGPVLVISAYLVTNNSSKTAVSPSNLRILTVL